MLLLDTQLWIWSVEGDTRRISGRTRRLLQPAASGDSLRISPVSLFEVTYLHVSGRLRLTRSLEQWIGDAMTLSGVRVTELSTAVAIDAGYIPRTALTDPIDRLIVATARHLDAVLVTADRAILEYGGLGHVRVHDGSR